MPEGREFEQFAPKEEDQKPRKISRRRFLAEIAGLGVAALGVSSLLRREKTATEEELPAPAARRPQMPETRMPPQWPEKTPIESLSPEEIIRLTQERPEKIAERGLLIEYPDENSVEYKYLMQEVYIQIDRIFQQHHENIEELGELFEKMPEIYPTIIQASREYKIPLGIAFGIAACESGGKTRAISSRGARGVLQIMPETGRIFGLKTEKDFFDPKKNINAGFKYLKQLFERYGRWDLALFAYNAGPAYVGKLVKNELPDKKISARGIAEDEISFTGLHRNKKTNNNYPFRVEASLRAWLWHQKEKYNTEKQIAEH